MGFNAAGLSASGMDVQLSTLSAPDRLEAIRAHMLGWRLPMDLRPLQPLNVSAKSHVTELGSSCLLSTTGSGATVERSDTLARDDTTPQLVVSVLGGGSSVVTQHQRTVHLRPGDLVVYQSTAPYRISFPHDTTRHSLLIQLDELRLPARLLTELSARPFVPGDPLVRLVSTFLRQLASTAPGMDGTARDAVEESATSLTRALLAGSAGGRLAADALGGSLETRLLHYLRQNFADRGITAGRIAAVHGISERHLYTVLTRAGISLRPWLREQRLTAAAAALSRPANRGLTIATVAYRWGFADHAHFTREFRNRFGMTPTQWRNHPDGSLPSQ